nr:MAG TPA: hypothetical protein [Caudoviricetes sp.]
MRVSLNKTRDFQKKKIFKTYTVGVDLEDF